MVQGCTLCKNREDGAFGKKAQKMLTLSVAQLHQTLLSGGEWGSRANFLHTEWTTRSSIGNKNALCGYLYSTAFAGRVSGAAAGLGLAQMNPSPCTPLAPCHSLPPFTVIRSRRAASPSGIVPKCPFAFTHPGLESWIHCIVPFHPPLLLQTVILVPEGRVSHSVQLCGKRFQSVR